MSLQSRKLRRATRFSSGPHQRFQASELHQYQPLDNVTSIRLVELLPELRDNELTLLMHHADLNEPPTYHAVSYYWGNPSPVRTVYINGKPHRITENLWRFLRQMCQDKKFQLYWTDALCINQHDVKERSQQVRHMDVVYRQAKCVIIWLGWQTKYEEDLRCLSLTAESIWPGWATKSRIPSLPEEENRLFQEKLLKLRFIYQNTDFDSNPYFSRTRVFQEIILATEGIVTAGSHSIPLDHFLSVACMIDYKITHSAGEAPDASQQFFNAVVEMRQTEDRKPLWELLSQLNSQSSDPRDIVYALLGITTVGNSRPAIEYIQVDYAKDIGDVFWDTILECTPPEPDEYNALFHGLTTMMGRNHVRPTVRGLAEYARARSTSERHKKGAALALETCTALDIFHLWLMDETDGADPDRRPYNLDDMAIGVTNLPHYYYRGKFSGDAYLETAVMLGFAMASRDDVDIQRPVYRDRLLHRIRSAGSLSPWRCRRHRIGFDENDPCFSDRCAWATMSLYWRESHDISSASGLSTLCGVCRLESVDGLSAHGFEGDYELTWHVPDTRFHFILINTVYGQLRGEHTWTVLKLKLRLGIIKASLSLSPAEESYMEEAQLYDGRLMPQRYEPIKLAE